MSAAPAAARAGLAEAQLAVEGIHCASCVQLIEMQVGAVAGVASVDVGLATHRARVRWDGARATLSDITSAIARAGYRAWPVGAAGADDESRRARRTALWRLFVAGFAMMQVMMYATPAYVAGDGEMEPDIERLLRIASFVLTVPVIAYAAAPLFAGAWRDLRRRRIGMDVPASLGLAVTFVASTWATFWGGGPVYFDSVSMFVFFLLGGRHLESLARERVGAAVRELARMQPARATWLPAWPASRDSREVAAQDLRAGDVVLVRGGEAMPADGTVVEGAGHHDEALISGESRPVAKAPGAPVTGGAINLGAPMVVRVDTAPADSRLSHLTRLVESAAAAKPAITLLADRHAATFLWAVLVLASCAALGWAWLDASRALPAAVSVLIVTCPCALSLAAPIAYTAAIGNLARRGVLVVRPGALEALARATHFVFDKTGTLTTGRMRVESVEPCGRLGRAEVLGLAARLEGFAVHPLAQALAMEGAPHAGLVRGAIEDAREVAGAGVEARVDGVRVRIGSPAFAAALGGAPVSADALARAGAGSVVVLADEGGPLAVFGIGDGARAGARELVRSLQSGGSAVALLSGDNAQAVRAVAEELGIDTIASGMAPEAKHARVRALQREGATVAMIGDGLNDAPVLAAAQVSIALGSGAPLAQTRSDMVLMSGRPADLGHAIATARRTLAVVRQNIAWAALYNAIAIPLAVTGVLTPWMAGLGMSASSLVVVLNSLRLMPRGTRPAPADAPADLVAGAA